MATITQLVERMLGEQAAARAERQQKFGAALRVVRLLNPTSIEALVRNFVVPAGQGQVKPEKRVVEIVISGFVGSEAQGEIVVYRQEGNVTAGDLLDAFTLGLIESGWTEQGWQEDPKEKEDKDQQLV